MAVLLRTLLDSHKGHQLVSIILPLVMKLFCVSLQDYGLSTFECREMKYSLLIYICYIFTYCYYYAWVDWKGSIIIWYGNREMHSL